MIEVVHSEGSSPTMSEEGTEKAALLDGLAKRPKHIPCSFLYDEEGSALYNKITELEEYYPYKTEIAMLEEHAADIVSHIPKGAIVVELGCGSATKTSILQRSLLQRDGANMCGFVGIDVSADFLDQAKANMLGACPGLLPERVEMIEASYLQGLAEARRRHPKEVLCVLWLGSSIGNLSHHESLDFFKEALSTCGPNTQMLVCTDIWKDSSILHRAYCDSQAVTAAFIKNGMKNAVSVASGGKTTVNTDLWVYDVVVNSAKSQVEMYLLAGESVSLPKGCHITKGERILMEISRKFLPNQLSSLAYQAGLLPQAGWHSAMYSIQMLTTPRLAFQLAQRDTDRIFSRIHDWTAMPISLRHPFCFYYGHVAAFSKINLLQDEPQSRLDKMFSRGIDPDVQDPKLCHPHPDVPDCWPTVEEITQYAHKARKMVQDRVSEAGQNIWLVSMCLEHESMHQETLCYMLAQLQKQQWEAAHLAEDGHLLVQNGVSCSLPLARWATSKNVKETQSEPGANGGSVRKGVTNGTLQEPALSQRDEWVSVPEGDVILGVAIDPQLGFNWDNEGPPQAPRRVKPFRMASHSVTNRQFREFMLSNGYKDEELWSEESYSCIVSRQSAPATWTVTAENDVWIHYPEGTSHWSAVSERPVWCSLAEAQAFCKSRGCRIMSELEYLRAKDHNAAGNRIHDLDCNGWELTSSPMLAMDGFVAMPDYPEYSADFYDGKHYVLRGSSPYTPPSVVRSSFRNFFQDVYPYHFAKFRCCRSV